ncbi:MAG: DNA polymerase [Methanobacteriaceae archaeon]|nr:DNA polymerase [Methanobacteriaceae archaeon]
MVLRGGISEPAISDPTETRKFVLLDIDYITQNSEAVIRLFGKLLGEDPDEEWDRRRNRETRHIIALDKNFKPYLYVIPSDNSDIDICIGELSELKFKGIIGLEKVCRSDSGELIEVLKITLKHPQNIPKIREKIRNFPSVNDIREYDIPFYRRYLIDKGLSPMNVVEVQGKVLSFRSSTCIFQVENTPLMLDESLPAFSLLGFDIEVYSPHGMPQSDRDPIIMISFSSNQGFQKVFSTKDSSPDFVEVVKGERELLQKFVETVNSIKPDFILGYNSDGFDFPYLRDRASHLGVPLRLGVDGSRLKFTRVGVSNSAMIRGRIHIDLYPNIRRYLHLNHHTLEHVHRELFGKGKMDIPKKDIHIYWEEGGDKLEKLFRYSLDDAVSVTQIGEKMLPLSIELTRIVGQPLFEVARMASGRHVEWYLIKKSFEYGNLVPNKASSSELSQREGIHVVGGYVKEPVKGLHQDIVYFDFRSLYPSIIISKNISPDSLIHDSEDNCHITPEYGHRFRKTPVGFIPSAMGEILEDRMRVKSLMKESEDKRQIQVLNVQQEALKRLANTIYGLYNHSSFRWYSLECSEAITAWGRDFLKKTMGDSEKQGFKPVYADTDGFFAIYVGTDDK